MSSLNKDLVIILYVTFLYMTTIKLEFCLINYWPKHLWNVINATSFQKQSLENNQKQVKSVTHMI